MSLIALLSPAKTLDFSAQDQTSEFTQSRFSDESAYLIGKLKKLSAGQIGKMMKINPELSELNRVRFNTWTLPFTPDNSKQALFAFRGDVYRGLSAETFNEEDIVFAQDHVRILSGLYGLLRPLDLMQPYRLEMGSRFKVTPTKTNLYKYWDNKIKDMLLDDLGDGTIVNLASNEYFKSVKAKEISNRIIDFQFKDLKNGEYKALMTYAKLGRGYMTNFLVKNKITNPEDLKGFDLKKYGFNERLSSENEWVFTRDEIEL